LFSKKEVGMLIYKITNTINGKIYIGQTIKSLSSRWSQHKSQTRYVSKGNNRKICRYLHSAMVKYGIDNFKIEEIDGANSQAELNYKEWLYIHKFDCIAPNGYNLRAGGHSRSVVSESTRKLLSERMSGKNNPMYGKSSAAQKAWITKYNKNKVITTETLEKLKASQRLRSNLGLNKGFTRKKTPEEIEKTASKIRKLYVAVSPSGFIYRISNINKFSIFIGTTSRTARKAAQLGRLLNGWKFKQVENLTTS
jgi:group I intron endonuclease